MTRGFFVLSNRAVFRLLIHGSAGFLLLLPAAAVLVDGWVAPAALVDPDGEGPGAPAPELAEQRAKGGRVHFETLSSVPCPYTPLLEAAPPELPAPRNDRRIDIRPKPVDPAGWLGRRHHRSPA